MKGKKIISYYKLSWLVKILVIAGTFLFIYHQVLYKYRSGAFETFLQKVYSRPNFIYNTIFLCVLMVLNWASEAYKWRFIIQKLEKISLFKSLQATLSGVTVSFFTPNRIGEFGGRIVYLENADKAKASVVTILGNMSQLLITIIFGTMGLLYYGYAFINIPPSLFYLLAFLTVLLSSLLLFSYFNVYLLSDFLKHFNFFRKIVPYSEALTLYSQKDLLFILTCSLIRYFIFSTQYLLLLNMMNVDLPCLKGLMVIAVIFFVMAAIPSVALTELGIRGSVSLFYISSFSSNQAGIVAAAFALWFVNLAIPALAGSLCVIGLRISKRRNE